MSKKHIDMLRNSKLFYNTFTNAYYAARALVRALAKEGVIVSDLIYSVSTFGVIYLLGHCYDDEWWGIFEAKWEFSYARISSTGRQYELTEVVLYNDD